MLDQGLLAGVLKWVALAFAFAATLWKLVAPKPDREDVDGRKRFTRSGVVTLAIVIGGVAVGALSLWVETLVKQKDAAETAQAKANADRLQALRDRLQIATSARARLAAADSRRGLAEIAKARAEGRADAASARDDAFRRETRERLRDLELAESVAAGARDNLARTGEALTQIERVLQPLEPMTVAIVWEIPGDTPLLHAATARLAVQGRIDVANARQVWSEQYHKAGPFDPPKLVHAARGQPLYPSPANDAERNVFANLVQPRTEISLFATGISTRTMLRRAEDKAHRLDEVGDLRIVIGPENHPAIDYVIATGALRFSLEGTVDPRTAGRTGSIVSWSDMERASGMIALTYGGGLLGVSRPISVILNSPSRRYVLAGAAMRKVPTRLPHAVYTLPPFTSEPTP